MRYQAKGIVLVVCVLLVHSVSSRAQESDLFDAKLSKWLGDPQYWTYKEGVLTAAAAKGVKRLPGTNPVGQTHTYLISKQLYGDFELACKVRTNVGSEPAVLVRGIIHNKAAFLVGGPGVQFGGLHGAIRGEYPPTNFYFSKPSPNPALHEIDQRGFIDYHITVVGKRITVKYDGITTVDEIFPKMPSTGVIAWQLTGISASDYLVRDIRFRELGKNVKAAAKPKINEPAQPAPPRHAAQARDLLASISGPYWLDGQPVAGGDMKAAVALAKSADAKVAELAKMAVDLYALGQLRSEQGRKTLEALQLQLELGAPLAFAKRIATGNTNPGVVRIVEDLMGSKVQDEFNKAYLLTYLGMDQSAQLRGKLQAFAEAVAIADIKVKKPVAVYCETTPEAMGTITIRNDSGRTLRNLLALGRVAVDAEAAREAGESEMAMGAVLRGIGFSKETVKGSVRAAELRSLAAQIDPGAMVFVAELKPGAAVRIPVAHQNYFRNAKSADVSIFSDEVSIVRQRPSNFYEAQITAKYPPLKKLMLMK